MPNPEQEQSRESQKRASEPDERQDGLGEPKEAEPTLVELADQRLVEQLLRSRSEIEDKIEAGEIDQARSEVLRNQLDDISIALVGLPISEHYPGMEKIIEQSQAVFDFLDLNVDLQAEYQNGKIVLPAYKEQRAAERRGYTESLIVPAHLRNRIIQKVQEKFHQTFGSEGIHICAEKATKATDPAKQSSNQPNQYHLIMLKPQQNIKDAYPETMNQTVQELLQYLSKENAKPENQNFQRRGLNLPEYLLLQTKYFLQEQRAGHIRNPRYDGSLMDRVGSTWLLEEVIRDSYSLTCLHAGWDKVIHGVKVYIDYASVYSGQKGARFAVVPKKK